MEGGFHPSRPILDDNSTATDLEDEIERFKATPKSILDERVRVITICTRSKRWRNGDIKSKRKEVCRIVRRRRRGTAKQEKARGAEKALRWAIRKARRECGRTSLTGQKGRACGRSLDIASPAPGSRPHHPPSRSNSRSSRGQNEDACGHLLPAAHAVRGRRGWEPPPGTAYQSSRASLSKAPVARRAQDGTASVHWPSGASTSGSRIRWLPSSRPALALAPRPVEDARGVAIPKPGKDDYGLAKSYRIISLLSCLGKIVEKVAAMMVSAHCETDGDPHPGRYDFDPGRTAAERSARPLRRSESPLPRPRRRGAEAASPRPSLWTSLPPSQAWPGASCPKDERHGAGRMPRQVD